jgi:hypothetical protein
MAPHHDSPFFKKEQGRSMNLSLSRARLGAIKFGIGIFCILVGGSLPIQSASAAETAAANPDPGKRFATVLRVRGEVVASGGSNGAQRTLREGDTIYVGERVRAPALAEAVLKTEDAGFLAIRPNTDFVAERFAAEDKPTDNFTVRLFTGSLRVVSGWLGRTARGGHKVVTPTATIGIRGTDHEPYVLSAELAASTSNREGTYDKVNRGGTTMEVGENKLDIDAGRVGFVRAAGKGFKERALITILLPVLLDKVPNFYVPGEFDVELDRLSQTADEDSQRQLEQKRKASVAACVPNAIAKAWLKQLDGAIVRRDATAIVAKFAADAAVRANVKDKDGGMTSVDIGRDELAQSTVAAMKGLTHYKQRRVTTEAAPADPAAGACQRITVKSVVIEQGRQSGKPYRFESVEEYVLELRAGKWLAVKAETTQK